MKRSPLTFRRPRKIAALLAALGAGLLFGLPTGNAKPVHYKVAGIVDSDHLNVRSGPGTRYPVIGQLEYNARHIHLTRRCRGPWCVIRHRNLRGWVHTDYLVPMHRRYSRNDDEQGYRDRNIRDRDDYRDRDLRDLPVIRYRTSERLYLQVHSPAFTHIRINMRDRPSIRGHVVTKIPGGHAY